MSDTTRTPSSFRHGISALIIGSLAALVGVLLRVCATGGELWLDEIWSLLKVSSLSNPLEIVTTVKHDNNHLLNSLWMWAWGPFQASFIYRAPSLLFSALLLLLLLVRRPAGESRRASILWLILVAASFPLTLYGTEARGYSLTLLCSALSFLSLTRLTANPFDRGSILTFAIAGIVGCLSHAIYALFLAPSVAWLLWRLATPPLNRNSRAILWLGIVPPVVVASALTLTFYRNMEIGGAPLLPYLEVAASTISVSFGGETLSSIDPTATGRNLLLAIGVTFVCVVELVAWIRSGSPIAWLVGLILITPWISVAVLQPHFILPRYFIIQLLLAYLLVARFLDRLMQQGRFACGVSLVILAGYLFGNTANTLSLAGLGRSHFVTIFETLASKSGDTTATVGGDQDFQNGLRLEYARIVAPKTVRLSYVANYRTATTPPRYIVRETIEHYEVFPKEFITSGGARYEEIIRYQAPQLNGSHVTLYELKR